MQIKDFRTRWPVTLQVLNTTHQGNLLTRPVETGLSPSHKTAPRAPL